MPRPSPASDAQVFHFLKVAVDGTTVTVTPVNSLGQSFDTDTYNFTPDSVPPSAPGSLTLTKTSSTKNKLSWTAATDNIGVSAYDIYRNGTYLATTGPGVTSYTDSTATAGASYTYLVAARDLAGNTASTSVTTGGTSDTTPPTAPTNLKATGTGYTSVSLSWGASTDNVGVTGYTVLRNGKAIATLSGTTTSYTDTGLTPGTAYTYQVTASDAAANASQPSNTLPASTQADTAPPTPPGTPTATSVTASQLGLSWAPSTDNVGVVGYQVLRGGSVIASVSGTSYTDTTVAPGTSYTYQIVSYDAAGNTAASGTLQVTTPAPGTVFSDGFETGDLSQWTTVGGLSVQQALTHSGGYAAQETSTGTATYAYKTLSASHTELWAQSWVYVQSAVGSANLFGFRGSNGGSIINLYSSPTGKIALRNNVAEVTTTSTTPMPKGGWHLLVLHAIINGTSGSVDVSLDGTAVPGLTLTGQNLGTNPITALQLGDTSTGRTYSIDFDDVAVSTSPE